MPAIPMNDAAERYSPEMADAFQPTETDLPATKKSLAVFDRRAAQNPIQIVTATVIALNVRMYGSMFTRCRGEKGKRRKGACDSTSSSFLAGATRRGCFAFLPVYL